MDRRIKYTKRVLNESLIDFLEIKDIKKITVTEICKDADVNRSTYYAHFTDPYDQLLNLKTELLGDMAQYIVNIDTGKLPKDREQYIILKSLLDYVEPNKKIFRILLEQNGDQNLREDILAILGEKIFLPEVDPNASEEEAQFTLMYASHGCFGLFYHWLTTDDISTERTAQMMASVTAKLFVK